MGCSGSSFEKNVLPMLQDMAISDAQIAIKHIDKMLTDSKLPAKQTIALQKLQIDTLKSQSNVPAAVP